jgi:hypothetical protein
MTPLVEAQVRANAEAAGVSFEQASTGEKDTKFAQKLGQL